MNALKTLVRLVYPHGAVRRVLRGPVSRMRFVVKPGMGTTYALAFRSYGFALYDELIAPGDVVYDIGANAGQMALFFSRRVGSRGRVVAFEPAPSSCAYLRRNLELNGIDNVTVVEAAVAAHVGEAVLDFAADTDTQAKLAMVETSYQVAGTTGVAVRTTTLDTYVEGGGPPPNFLKIDTEGAAAVVLAGAERTLDRSRPGILIELHGPEEQRAVDEHLVGRGWRLTDSAGVPVASASERWTSPLIARKR